MRSCPQGILTIVPAEGGIYHLINKCLLQLQCFLPREPTSKFKLSLVVFLIDVNTFQICVLSPTISVTKNS